MNQFEKFKDNFVTGFICFIGWGENQRGAFPTNLTELNEDVEEFVRRVKKNPVPTIESFDPAVLHPFTIIEEFNGVKNARYVYRWNEDLQRWEFWHRYNVQWVPSIDFEDKPRDHPIHHYTNCVIAPYEATWAEPSSWL